MEVKFIELVGELTHRGPEGLGETQILANLC